jgi:hypothetical protein
LKAAISGTDILSASEKWEEQTFFDISSQEFMSPHPFLGN